MAGRTYGRTTGWALVNGGLLRVRVAGGGRSESGEVSLYLTPYVGGEEFLHPARLTAKTKKQALQLAGIYAAVEYARQYQEGL